MSRIPPFSLNRCMMASDGTFYVPGETSQCEGHAAYKVPGELGEYFTNGRVCKLHLKTMLQTQEAWLEAFEKMKVPKGLDIADLQLNMMRQALFSHVIVKGDKQSAK